MLFMSGFFFTQAFIDLTEYNLFHIAIFSKNKQTQTIWTNRYINLTASKTSSQAKWALIVGHWPDFSQPLYEQYPYFYHEIDTGSLSYKQL